MSDLEGLSCPGLGVTVVAGFEFLSVQLQV